MRPARGSNAAREQQKKWRFERKNWVILLIFPNKLNFNTQFKKFIFIRPARPYFESHAARESLWVETSALCNHIFPPESELKICLWPELVAEMVEKHCQFQCLNCRASQLNIFTSNNFCPKKCRKKICGFPIINCKSHEIL